MGFYHPATLVKDAQRHGLKMLPVDVTKSEWRCTLEPVSGFGLRAGTAGSSAGKSKPETGNRELAVRLGLRYVRGLREEAAQAILRERTRAPLASIHDLTHRVPELRQDELETLAEIGALNQINSGRDVASYVSTKLHRRDALWQVQRAVRRSGPLLDELPEPDAPSPLSPMTHEERLVADFRGTGLTVGPHPMAYHRARMDTLNVRRAVELSRRPEGRRVRVAGCVIARQRPGTAKGFLFLSLEDETGIANAIVTPGLFQQNRFLLAAEPFLLVEGVLQNQDSVVSVKAERVFPLSLTRAQTRSHDFH
jgi:error-prone DNA polymerase